MRPLLISLVLQCALAAPGLAQSIPFQDKLDPATPTTVKVKLQVGTHMTPAWFTVDTGSVGIVLPATALPADAPVIERGQIEYTSSGVVWSGFWTTQTITFTDANDQPLATSTAQVFAAQTPSCTGKGPHAASCDPAKLAAKHPHMMGIGFGRPDTYAFPTRNPAIHVAHVAEQSYRIDQTSLTLGVPSKSLPARCLQQTLQPNATPGFAGDWQTPTGTLAIDDTRAPANILIDTGITDMLIGAAQQPTSGTLHHGTRVTVGFLGGKLTAAYQVHATAAPAAPTAFHWIHFHGTAFVNTGITPLARYVYYFNSTKGIVALCPLP